MINLTHRFPDEEEGLDEVSFAIDQGTFTVITGKIGSGKSTLVRALLGLVPATGRDLLERRSRRGSGVVLRPAPLRLHRPGASTLLRLAR